MAADLGRGKPSDGDAGQGKAAIVVATAAPLEAKAQAKWHKRIAALFPAEGDTATEIRFEADPDLVGGAELRLPHTVVKFTWADLLAKAGTELSRDQAAE